MRAHLSGPRPARLLAGLLGALLLAASPAPAQEAPPAPAQPEAPPEPVAISPEAVPEEAERVKEELSRLRAATGPAEAADAVEAELPDLHAEVKARVEAGRDALAADASVGLVREQRQQTLALDARLSTLAEELDAAGRGVAESLDRLAELDAIWEATRKQAREEGAARATATVLDATRREINAAKAETRALRDRLLGLRERISRDRASLSDLQGALEQAVAGGLPELIAARDPHLLHAENRKSLAEEFGPDGRARIADRWRTVADYVAANPQPIAGQLALVLAFWIGFNVARNRARRRAAEEWGLHDARRVWEHPLAMAIVVGWLLTRELHPFAPPFYWDLAQSIPFLASLWIIYNLSSPAGRRALLGLLVIFALSRVRFGFEALPATARFVYQGELLVAFAFLYWLTRPARLATMSHEEVTNPVVRTAGVVARAAMVLLAVAGLAGLAGWNRLAELIGIGVLQAAFAAVFLYGATLVGKSVLAYAVRVRPFRLLNMVARHRALVQRRLSRAIEWGAALFWGYLALGAFDLWGWAVEATTGLLAAGFSVGNVGVSFGNVAVFFLALWISFKVARFVSFLLEEEVFRRVELGRGVAYALGNLSRYVVLFVGFLFALAAGGFHLDRMAFLVGGLGVGIGFGLQNVVNNFVSGLILLFERPIQVGDSVEVGQGLFGEVRHIGIRASVVRTWNGAEVVVPNGDLIANTVTNWTLSDRSRRLDLAVGVAYGSDPKRVIELLLEVAGSHENVLADPAPSAHFMGFGDSSLDFMLRAWIRDFDVGLSTRSALNVGIDAALSEAGIEKPFPQRDLHLRSVDPEAGGRLGARPGADTEDS